MLYILVMLIKVEKIQAVWVCLMLQTKLIAKADLNQHLSARMLVQLCECGVMHHIVHCSDACVQHAHNEWHLNIHKALDVHMLIEAPRATMQGKPGTRHIAAQPFSTKAVSISHK